MRRGNIVLIDGDFIFFFSRTSFPITSTPFYHNYCYNLSLSSGHGTNSKQLIPLMLSSLSHLRCLGVASYNEHTVAMTTPRLEGMEQIEGEFEEIEVSGSYLHQMYSLVNQEWDDPPLPSPFPFTQIPWCCSMSIESLQTFVFIAQMEIFGLIKPSYQLGVSIFKECSPLGIIVSPSPQPKLSSKLQYLIHQYSPLISQIFIRYLSYFTMMSLVRGGHCEIWMISHLYSWKKRRLVIWILEFDESHTLPSIDPFFLF